MNPSNFAASVASVINELAILGKPMSVRRVARAKCVAAALILSGRAMIYSATLELDNLAVVAHQCLRLWLSKRSVDEVCEAIDAIIADLRTVADGCDLTESLSATGNPRSIAVGLGICCRIEGLGAAISHSAMPHSGDLSVMVAIEQVKPIYDAARERVIADCDSWLILHAEATRRIMMANDEAVDREKPWPCMAHWIRIVEAFGESIRDRMGDLDGQC